MNPNPRDQRDEDPDKTCGVQCCGSSRHPISFLQRFATPTGALLTMGLGVFAGSFIVNGHTNSVISTVEKRFELSSTESGFISSCYDIASCAAVLFVTYLGGRSHKPQWLGWGTFLMGIGSVTFSLPHFFAPAYTFTNDLNICDSFPIETSCTFSSIKNFRWIFYFALFLVGIGATPLYTLGVTYLDENVEQRLSAFYNGCFISFSIIGPGVGFLVGSALLRIYTNPTEEVSITKSDGQWVGAWWIGALGVGIFTLFVAFPILFLPKQLPGTDEHRKQRNCSMDHRAEQDEEFGTRLRDFPRCVMTLVRNSTFLTMGMGRSVDALFINGLVTFAPKYMETIYGLDPSESGTYFGLVAILGGAGGQFIGGALLSRFDVAVKSMLHISYITPLLAMLFSLAFLIHCDDPAFAGVNVPYNMTADPTLQLNDVCNLNCTCNSDVYSPVCGSDKVTYYSPCFAGCLDKIDVLFSNCSCIPGVGEATAGKCTETGCGSGGLFILFCILIFLYFFFTFVNEASTLQITLRCVAFNQRSFAIGLQWFIIRIVGMIPGPIAVGAIIDRACTHWSMECGERGSCLSYNSTSLSLYFVLFAAINKVIDSGIFFVGMMLYKPKEQNQAESPTNGHNGTGYEVTPDESSSTKITPDSQISNQETEFGRKVAAKSVPGGNAPGGGFDNQGFENHVE